MTLPTAGMSRAAVMEALRHSMAGDARWDEGRTFALVYGVDEDHLALLREAYALFMATNGLGAGRIFPSLRRLESEVIAITAGLLGDARCPGNITSGGTESILMGVRAARQRARAERPGVARPEMVLPRSAHPAFDRAAELHGIRTVRTPLTKAYVADVDAMAGAVTADTIAIVGSAPNYPFGTIDPIPAIAEVARRHGLHLHVDACVGGFALPFLRRLGHAVPPFDFSVPGVSTISADVHKYGFGARGTSVILYRDETLQRHAGFTLDGWSAGPYRTATMAGSRPGGMVAAAWAALHYFGEEGYLRLARTMWDATGALRRGIGAIPGFRVLGDPAMYLFAFAADTVDVRAVADLLAGRGWYLGRQATEPPSLHVVLTPLHAPVVGEFLQDLAQAAREVGRTGQSGTTAGNYGSGLEPPPGATVSR